MNDTYNTRTEAKEFLKLLLTHQQIPPGVMAVSGTHTANWCADFIDEMAKRLTAAKSGG